MTVTPPRLPHARGVWMQGMQFPGTIQSMLFSHRNCREG